jgi:Bacterial transcriptional activator domain
MAPSTLHSIASDARASLGRSMADLDYLPRSRGRLQLSATVTSDWTRLQALTLSTDPTAWASALSLVRGRPLLGLRSSEWALMEGVQTEMEQAIGRLALRAGEEALRRGEPGHAVWSARQGLRASPLDETLFRLLLRAADLEGDPARVEGVMGELVCLLSDGQPDLFKGSPPRCGPAQLALVHPETSGLYGRISRRKRCQHEPEASGVPVRL